MYSSLLSPEIDVIVMMIRDRYITWDVLTGISLLKRGTQRMLLNEAFIHFIPLRLINFHRS